MIDHVGQLLAETREQFLARQASLRHQAVDLIGAQRAREIARRNLLVRAICDPRAGVFPLPTRLQLLEQIPDPPRAPAARGGAAEQAAQSALENVAKATTKT